jgi:hypothetical protein
MAWLRNEIQPVGCTHRYLMPRLSLQVVYLWRHVSSTAPPFILWWSNLKLIFSPLHRTSPFIGELRCQAIQMEHGPYIAERTQNSVYIVRCLWLYDILGLMKTAKSSVKKEPALNRGTSRCKHGFCLNPLSKILLLKGYIKMFFHPLADFFLSN